MWIFIGNEALTDHELRKAMKKTRRKTWWNFFSSSKFTIDGIQGGQGAT